MPTLKAVPTFPRFHLETSLVGHFEAQPVIFGQQQTLKAVTTNNWTTEWLANALVHHPPSPTQPNPGDKLIKSHNYIIITTVNSPLLDLALTGNSP